MEIICKFVKGRYQGYKGERGDEVIGSKRRRKEGAGRRKMQAARGNASFVGGQYVRKLKKKTSANKEKA